MINLPLPSNYNYPTVLNLCSAGITGNQSLLNEFNAQHVNILPFENVYSNHATAGNLYVLPPLRASTSTDPKVIGNLKKSDLEKIYTQYFSADEKPARDVYDAIKNAAKGNCPYCGGIGTPKNLDHFLPKTQYPQFSVLPLNLIPACRDCNMEGKGQAVAISAEDQIIHPYCDAPHFFSEQWIFALYHQSQNEDEPSHFEYFVKPPEHWSDIDKRRVEKCFETFDLAERYSNQAAKNLNLIIGPIKRDIRNGVPVEETINDLLIPELSQCMSINHWQFGMYQALIDHLRQ